MTKISALFLLPLLLASEPVPVRYTEGAVQGFLVLRSADGKVLAGGDLTQVVHGNRVTAHLIFRFQDGSVDDEIAVFTTAGVFRLVSDRHIQKGPSFPKPSDILIDATTGKVTVHYQDNGHEKTDIAHMKLPPDVANGVIYDILKNISPATKQTTLSYVANAPKARLVKLKITCLGEEKFLAGGLTYKAARFDLKVDLGGLTGLIAPIVGKQPDDMYVWMTTGAPPAFLKLMGQRYEGGPVWTIENSPVIWPQSKP